MEAIKNFLEAIWNAIQTVWDVLVSIVTGLIEGFKIVYNAVISLKDYVSYLPTILVPVALTTITILSILFIVNRTGGKSE